MTLTFQPSQSPRSTDILFYTDLVVPPQGADLDFLFFNTRFMSIVNAVNELAAVQAGYANTESQLVSLGLTRINEVLGPLLTLLQEAATNGFLMANAVGPTVSLVNATNLNFTINSAGVELFTPTPWLLAQDTTDDTNWGILSLTSYIPSTGLLATRCVYASKTQASTSWNISCSAGVIPAMMDLLAQCQAAQAATTESGSTIVAQLADLNALIDIVGSGPVVTVAGRSGVVTLGISDIAALSSTIAGLVTTNTYTSGLATKQNSSATLSALTALSWVADTMFYATSPSTFGLTALTAFARTLLACTSGAAAITALGAATPASVAAQISSSAILSGQIDALFRDITGTSYAFVLTDNSIVVTLTNTAAIAASLPNNIPKGWNVLVYQGDVGVITFSAAGGGTLRNRQSQFRSAGRDAVVSILCVSNTTGTNAVYVLGGDTQT